MRVFFSQSDFLSPRLNLCSLNVFKMCWGAELDSSWRCVHLSWPTWPDAFVTDVFMQMIFLMIPRSATRWTAIWLMSPARIQEQPGYSMKLKPHMWKAKHVPPHKKIHIGENILTTSWGDGIGNWCNWCWLSSRFAFLEAFFCIGVMLGNPIGTLVQVPAVNVN